MSIPSSSSRSPVSVSNVREHLANVQADPRVQSALAALGLSESELSRLLTLDPDALAAELERRGSSLTDLLQAGVAAVHDEVSAAAAERSLPKPVQVAVDAVETVQRAQATVSGMRQALDAQPAFQQALHSFVDPSLTAPERRQRLTSIEQAILDVVPELLELGFDALPKGALSSAAAGAAGNVDGLREQTASQWYAPYLPSGDLLQLFGEGLEELRGRIKDPVFREGLVIAVKVAGIATSLELDQLQHIALDLAPDKRAKAGVAIKGYLATALDAVITGLLGDSGALQGQVRALLSLTLLKQGSFDREQGAALLTDAVAGLAFAKPDSLPRSFADVRSIDSDALKARLAEAQTLLLDELKSIGATTPATNAALGEVFADISSIAFVATSLLKLVGAIRNENIPAVERKELIKQSAKDAGPVFVKLLQTLINEPAILEGLTESAGKDSTVLAALRDLQEHVPEMPPEEVRAVMEESLGKKVEDVFINFDFNPLASASIGQVHRAQRKIWNGQIVDVVVKVQRDNLKADFERTNRAVTLVLRLMSGLVDSGWQEIQKRGDIRTPDGKPVDGLLAVGIWRLIESTVQLFLDSFLVEMDFKNEAKNIRGFRRAMAGEAFVAVPHVFQRASSDRVITMEHMRIEKVPSLMLRYAAMLEARANPLPTGALAAGAQRDDDATTRLALWSQQEFGMEPSQVSLEPASDGVRFSLRFDDAERAGSPHPTIGTIAGTFTADGVIHPDVPPPVFDDASVRTMRDRFYGSFVSQTVVHRLLHGDPHLRNFGVMGDGETLVLLDFGNVVRIPLAQLGTPLAFLTGWVTSNPELMAKATMSMLREHPGSHIDREKSLENVKAVYAGALQKANAELPPTEAEALAAETRVAPIAGDDVEVVRAFLRNGALTVDAKEVTKGTISGVRKSGQPTRDTLTFTASNGQKLELGYDTSNATGARDKFDNGRGAAFHQRLPHLNRFTFSVNGRAYAHFDPGAREIAKELTKALVRSRKLPASPRTENLVANLALIGHEQKESRTPESLPQLIAMAAMSSGMGLDPMYLQGLKVMVSIIGDVGAFHSLSAEYDMGDWQRMGMVVGGDVAAKLSPQAAFINSRKDARVTKNNRQSKT